MGQKVMDLGIGVFQPQKGLKRQPFFFDRLMNQGAVPFLLLNLVTVASLRMALDLTLMGKQLTGRLRGRTLLSEEEKPTLLAKSLMMLMTLFIRYVQHFVKKMYRTLPAIFVIRIRNLRIRILK
jgi:hypothetical protein